jgi:hypothetical protein
MELVACHAAGSPSSYLSPMTVLYQKTENGICLAYLYHFDFVLVTAGYNPLPKALF